MVNCLFSLKEGSQPHISRHRRIHDWYDPPAHLIIHRFCRHPSFFVMIENKPPFSCGEYIGEIRAHRLIAFPGGKLCRAGERELDTS